MFRADEHNLGLARFPYGLPFGHWVYWCSFDYCRPAFFLSDVDRIVGMCELSRYEVPLISLRSCELQSTERCFDSEVTYHRCTYCFRVDERLFALQGSQL